MQPTVGKARLVSVGQSTDYDGDCFSHRWIEEFLRLPPDRCKCNQILSFSPIFQTILPMNAFRGLADSTQSFSWADGNHATDVASLRLLLHHHCYRKWCTAVTKIAALYLTEIAALAVTVNSLGIMLLSPSPRLSAISCRGRSFFIRPSSLCSNVSRYSS